MSPMFEVAGQVSRRRLVSRSPDAARLLADLAAWLATTYPDEARVADPAGAPPGAARIALHPAAGEVVLEVADDGRVSVRGETAMVGPGYHRFLGRLVERLGAEFAIEWSTEGLGTEAFADRATVERRYLEWLGPTLADALRARRRGASTIHLGTPAGHRYVVDGALATVLGPRDDAWLEAAIADPRVALDLTPWWSDATDGRYLLRRALVLLWLDVRWRRPALPGEGEVLDEVHRLLGRAFAIGPTLDIPWHAWAEIVALRGIDDVMARQVLERTSGRPAVPSPIGYRRQPVTIDHAGWTLEIPGAFAERRGTDEWWGGGAGRGVTLAATRTGSLTAEAFLAQVAGGLGPEALTHRDGEVVGRARITSDSSSGVEVGVLDGYSAVPGSGAAIRIAFDDPADWRWAVDLWRSLRPE